MDIESFIEDPLLMIVFSIFLTGILARIAFSFLSIYISNNAKSFGWSYIMLTIGRSLFPFHKTIMKRPMYTIIRYVFHICLVVVPIWLAGHIMLLEMSWLELSWTPLPDVIIDYMTIILLCLAVFFIIRRIILSKIRSSSSPADYLLIIIIILTYSSGYFLAHGTLDSISFFEKNMFLIHVLCGEIMLIMAVFLFIRSRIDDKKCTGCAACELSCPTGTLEYKDIDKYRYFCYSHYQCVCCGSCIGTCPEEATEIRHEIGLRRFFQIVSKREIRSVELKLCENCGALFAPEPQLEKIRETVTDDYINFCTRCKNKNFADVFRKQAPWPKKIIAVSY